MITAQKRIERLQDVPVAVTALTSRDLAIANVDAQLSLPRITPNLSFVSAASLAAPFIRGVGTSYATTGLESSVPVYLDDTYLPRAANAFFSLNDVERVEVLKGPQGTLFGRNASGGAIRIITADPKSEFQASANATYGSFDRKAVSGMINIPVTSDVALRISGRHDENDGYVHNIYPGHPGRIADKNQNTITAKLLIDPAGPLSIKIEGDYSHQGGSENENYASLFPGLPEQLGVAFGGCTGKTFYETCLNVDPLLRLTQYGATGRIDYDFGFATLSSITAFRHAADYARADVDATGFPLLQGVGRAGDARFSNTNQFTQELQLISDNSKTISYVLGLYYLHERSSISNQISGYGVTSDLDDPMSSATVFEGAVRTRSYAVYAQADWNIVDKLTLTLGGRYTDEKKRLLMNRLGTGPADELGAAIPGQIVYFAEEPVRDVSFKKFVPKATLSFRPQKGLLFYGTYSVGFKSGGFNLPQFPSDSVRPETVNSYEAGIKFERGNIRFNGAAFHYTFDDRQVQTFEGSATRTTNAARARINGLEGDLTWVPARGLELGAGAGYLDAKYTSYRGQAVLPCADVASLPTPDAIAVDGVAAAQAGCVAAGGLGLATVAGQDLSGKKLEVSPSFTGYVRAAYTIPLDELGSITISSVVNRRSTAYFDPANIYADRSRTMVSGQIGWVSKNGKLSASIYGENLTNRKYNTQMFPLALGGFRLAAPPRTVNAQIGWKF